MPVHLPACRLLGEDSGVRVEIRLPAGRGATQRQVLAICGCAVHSECVPSFRCTAAHKQAVRESWTRSDGGDAYSLMTCQQCAADGLGFEPL